MYYMDKQTVTVVLTGPDGEKFHTLECPSKVCVFCVLDCKLFLGAVDLSELIVPPILLNFLPRNIYRAYSLPNVFSFSFTR